MKVFLILMLILRIFTGCGSADPELERAMNLRSQLLAHSCSFDAEITADYGDKIHTFTVYCEGDPQGNLGFQIKSPETIEGITGQLSAGGGKLTFDETALAFPLLADGQVTPVSAPWLLLKTLQGGYLTSAGMEENDLRLTIHDSYEADALQLDIWLDGEDKPLRADILYDGRRILSLSVANFQIL